HRVDLALALDLENLPAPTPCNREAIVAKSCRIDANDKRPDPLMLGFTSRGDGLRPDEAVMPRHLERFRCRRRIFLLEQQRVFQFRNLIPTPRDLRVIEAIERSVFPLLVGRLKARSRLLAVFVLPEPRHEDRDEIASAILRIAP